MYNKSTIIGRLGTDPEIRFTADQKAIANLRVGRYSGFFRRNTFNLLYKKY
jgi:single-stranded DNA-binding protein